MKGYFEVNYSIYIKNEDNFYKFAKESIINNTVEYEPLHIPITSKYVYDTFYMLFPILKNISKDLITIERNWSSWHPLNFNEKIPINKYNKQKDNFVTNCYTAFIFVN